MALAAGTRLGPYEVHSLIGAGGMGEVYRARDTQLKRDVALKILPAELALEPERLARFDREAQALAALNHPHIAQVYGFAHEGDVRAIVMELVDGATLAERIARGPMPIDEALPLAVQLADALENAHERGIVHRDLKPANIKLTHDGVVKVLDFGLAKALAGDTAGTEYDLNGDSPTMTGPVMSRIGVILGTAAYMAPEQARGAAVDRRADIWAFGVVLFEMLTGKPCFAGDTVTDVLAAVVRAEPAWPQLPADAPPRLRRMLERCLTKDRKQRLQAIGDARIELQEIRDHPEAAALHSDTRPPEPPSRWIVRATASILVVTAIGALAFAAGRLFSAVPPNWAGQRLSLPDRGMGPRISPDGSLLAFQAMVGAVTQVAVMKPDSGDWQVLTHQTTGWVNEISWKPDNSLLYYDRWTDAPLGIFSVRPMGTDEEHPVLEKAFLPQALPDGSLLAVKLNERNKFQVVHFWPDSGREQALPIELDASRRAEVVGGSPLRASRSGRTAFAVGRRLGGEGHDDAVYLYAIDLGSGVISRVETGLKEDSGIIALAPGEDEDAVLAALQSNDVARILALSTSGRTAPRTLLTLPGQSHYLDLGAGGTLCFDQWSMSRVLARLRPEGGHVERLGTFSGNSLYPVKLPGDRIAYVELLGGRTQMMTVAAGEDPLPLIGPGERTSGGLTPVGRDRVAVVVGGSERTIAVVTTATRRIGWRHDVEAGAVKSLSSSPDGKTLYFTAAGGVWSMPIAEHPLETKICAGDEVLAAPDGRSLLVKRVAPLALRLFRVPLEGTAETEIKFNGPYHLGLFALSSMSIGPGERLVAPLMSLDSWYHVPCIVDLKTGNVTPIPVDFPGDWGFTAFTEDGRILAAVNDVRFSVWRFRPEDAGSRWTWRRVWQAIGR